MQMVYRQPLDQFTHGNNKFLGPSDADDRAYDCIIVRLFIRHILFLRDQLFNHICKICGQCFSDL